MIISTKGDDDDDDSTEKNYSQYVDRLTQFVNWLIAL